MTTFTTPSGVSYTITFANSRPSGYGHCKISVDVLFENGKEFTFVSTTNNMPGLDAANDLEGQERYEALYLLVSSILDSNIDAFSNV